MRSRVLVVLLLIAASASAIVAFGLTRSDEAPTSCPADGLLGPNGETYSRSSDKGCRFVDDNGDVITALNGQSLCYDVALVALVGPDCE